MVSWEETYLTNYADDPYKNDRSVFRKEGSTVTTSISKNSKKTEKQSLIERNVGVTTFLH